MRIIRTLALAALLLAAPHAGARQVTSVLHITVALLDADMKPAPVVRHVLLVSDNPASAAPRRVMTGADGTASVKLSPGNYTVESDRPVAFLGKEYQWTQTLDVPAGRDTTLALTAANAESGPITAASAPLVRRPSNDPPDALVRWQDSVVALWTPTTHASGFVIDAKGLLATNQQVVGTATSIEVQLTPELKVAARVLVADQARDVAILWIAPAMVASMAPVPLGCPQTTPPPIARGQELFTIGTPLGQQTRLTSGAARRIDARTATAELSLALGSAGGPVFAANGSVVGLTSMLDEREVNTRDDVRVVRLGLVCEALASAQAKMAGVAPPRATRLPVEPTQTIPADTLKDAASRRAGSLSPYPSASADFDLAFITPIQAHAGLQSMDFSNWSDYVDDGPSVLLVRVTPKQVEKFWTTVARGVARTQGIALPPIKRFTSGFLRMRAFCGDAEVAPIHPFLLERRLSETAAIYEGLYVFDPDALGPHCSAVKFELFSDKTPAKADVKVIEPKVLQQVWQDFAMYRALK